MKAVRLGGIVCFAKRNVDLCHFEIHGLGAEKFIGGGLGGAEFRLAQAWTIAAEFQFVFVQVIAIGDGELQRNAVFGGKQLGFVGFFSR